MREDFSKLLCERERKFPKYGKADEKKPYPGRNEIDDYQSEDCDHPYDNLPSKDKLLGRKLNGKYLNENLSPLVNFLASRKGKHWDKVYSEICLHFKKDKAINLHIFQHLFQYVELKTRIGPNNKVQMFNPFRYRQSDRGWIDVEKFDRPGLHLEDYFYVHPKTKVLCPIVTNSKKKIDKRYDWRWFSHPTDPCRKFYLDENNIWHMVIFERILLKHEMIETLDKISQKNKIVPNVFSCLFYNGILNKAPTAMDLYYFWGDKIRAIGKFQLCKKDIKSFKLNELRQKQNKIPRRNPRKENENG